MTAYINEEFARIQEEEVRLHGTPVSDIVPENVPEDKKTQLLSKAGECLNQYSGKKKMTAQSIMSAIAEDSHITIAQMAQTAKVNDRTIKRYLREFQEVGALERQGSDTNGEWILK